MGLQYENVPAIKLAKNHSKTKHVEVDCHFVTEKLKKKMWFYRIEAQLVISPITDA